MPLPHLNRQENYKIRPPQEVFLQKKRFVVVVLQLLRQGETAETLTISPLGTLFASEIIQRREGACQKPEIQFFLSRLEVSTLEHCANPAPYAAFHFLDTLDSGPV